MRKANSLLIIDDDSEWVDDISHKFTKTFNDVHCANDANFKKFIKNRIYDAILIDYDMPIKKGNIVYSEIFSIDKSPVTIIISNHNIYSNKKIRELAKNKIKCIQKSKANFHDKIIKHIDKFKFREPEDINIIIFDDDVHKIDKYFECLGKIGFSNIIGINNFEEAFLSKFIEYDMFIVDICWESRGLLELKGEKIIKKLQEYVSPDHGLIVPVSQEEFAKDTVTNMDDSTYVYPHYCDDIRGFEKFIQNIFFRSHIRKIQAS
jgi:CheY-like chemotaxis protein